ncbi:MAG: hypothetical protein Q8O76_11430 [Chloroflexota bacterium]|nr:hypothetical protein [Chloroflexota bacterium]
MGVVVTVAVGSGDGEGEARGRCWAITVGEGGGAVGSAGASSPHCEMTKAKVAPTKRKASKTTKSIERLEDIIPPSERVPSFKRSVNFFIEDPKGRC